MAEAALSHDFGLERAWDEICELGLQQNVAELDAYGYTIVPPEIASPDGFIERLLEVCLDVSERRHGVRPDLEMGYTHTDLERAEAEYRFTGHRYRPGGPLGDVFHSLLLEDEVFEQVLMNRVRLALVTHLLGYNAVMSGIGCWIKGPTKAMLALHADNPLPSPFPSQCMGCQSTFWLTDFNRENGSTAVVPGSHKLLRQPIGDEKIIPAKPGDPGNPDTIPLEGKAGSLLIHHPCLWHGAYNRTAPGLRVSVTCFMTRPFIRTGEDYTGKIPQEVLDRHGPRFAILTQQGIMAGYSSSDEEKAKVAHAEKYISAYAKEFGNGYRPVES